MKTVVQKMGNSSGVSIPKHVLAQIGVKMGDELDLLVEDGRIVIVPLKRHPRAGWAEASRRIAEAGDDGLVWPEMKE